MHPLLRSFSGIAGFFLALLPIWLMFALVFSATTRSGVFQASIVAFPAAIVLGLVCLVPYYPCRGIPLGSRPVWVITGLHTIPAMFFAGAVLAATHASIMGLSRPFPGLADRFQPVMPVIGAISVITYLLSTALHYAFEAFERSRTAELLSREAQLKALKAQVNPHFLFNSLNSISALTSIDDKRAREMCLRLSDFLRSSLTLGERVSIPFAEELALARTYLGVEQVRFGERLQFTQDVDEHCALCEVPPLMIQPLVENAIKHGVATLVEGGLVSIRAHCQADTLRVVVENSFDPEAPPADKSGFGIANVRRRLQTRYGSAATLDIAVEQNTYRVTIAAPCRRDRT